MPTRPLPIAPSLQRLKHRATDLMRAWRASDAQALHRIREFHPGYRGVEDAAIARGSFLSSDAKLTIAREYGFDNWLRLKAYVENNDDSVRTLSYLDRILDPDFRRAVELLDAGDAAGLRRLLSESRDIVGRRVVFEGGNYFINPTLLEFIAGNPQRTATLPPNIVDIARTILEAGTADQSSLDSALALVASSKLARESGVQRQLVHLLRDFGADPNAGKLPSVLYGEFEGVRALMECGATDDLITAAATGRADDAGRLISQADAAARQLALSLAAQHGYPEIVRLLLDRGVDLNRFAPPGGHSHATPLHQAALAGHGSVVRLLVARGAQCATKDILFGRTPAEWAEFRGHQQIAAYLRSV